MRDFIDMLETVFDAMTEEEVENMFNPDTLGRVEHNQRAKRRRNTAMKRNHRYAEDKARGFIFEDSPAEKGRYAKANCCSEKPWKWGFTFDSSRSAKRREDRMRDALKNFRKEMTYADEDCEDFFEPCDRFYECESEDYQNYLEWVTAKRLKKLQETLVKNLKEALEGLATVEISPNAWKDTLHVFSEELANNGWQYVVREYDGKYQIFMEGIDYWYNNHNLVVIDVLPDVSLGKVMDIIVQTVKK